MTDLLTTISARARNALGGFGANAVIVLVLGGGLPVWAQTLIFLVVWGLLELWTLSPDSDGDGVPDWLEAKFPREARALEYAIAHGWDDIALDGLDRIARRVMRRRQGIDPSDVARCPWWSPLAAALPVVGILTACGGGAQSVSTASESVAGTITGAASFDCDSDGCERDGVGTAEIVATAEVCLDLFGGPVFCWPMTVDASAFVTDDRAEAVVCVEAAPFVKPACVSTAGE